MSAEKIALTSVFKHRCPSCHKGTLYLGIVKPVTNCAHCGLDFSGEDTGDGPAFFAITIAGFVITFLAAFVENRYALNYWLHAAIWIPATFGLCIWLLRVVKSYLIHLQYQTGALTNTEKPPHNE